MRTKNQVILDGIHVWYVVNLLPQCFADCLLLMKENKRYFYVFGAKFQMKHTTQFTQNFKHFKCTVQSYLSTDFVNIYKTYFDFCWMSVSLRSSQMTKLPKIILRWNTRQMKRRSSLELHSAELFEKTRSYLHIMHTNRLASSRMAGVGNHPNCPV